MKILGRIAIIASVLFTVVDMVTDVVLAVDYCATDNPWWCGLTWAFIAVPLITIPIFLYWSWNDTDKLGVYKFWKGVEICFEAGPQLLLQLYIMARSDLDPTAVSGNERYHDHSYT